jgi:hypothetical protein
MRFYTPEEAGPRLDLWCGRDYPFFISGGFPSGVFKGYAVAEVLEQVLQPWEECLLMVDLTGVWSCNLHLYYRVRQSYGDLRLVEEAPGHLFLKYEQADLVSFLQLGITAGWDMRVVTDMPYAKLEISHDEWFEACFLTQESCDEWVEAAKRYGLRLREDPLQE